MLAMLDLELEKDYVQGSLGLWRYCDNMPVSIKFNKSEDQIKNSLLMIKSEKFVNEKTPLPSKFNKNEDQTKNSLLTIKPEKIVNGKAPVRNKFDKNEDQIKKPVLLVDPTNFLKHIQTAFCKILNIPAIFMIKSDKIVNGKPLVLNKSDKNEVHIKNSLLKHIQTALSKRSDIPAFFMLYYSFHHAPFPHCFRCPNDCEWINTPCSHKLWCTDCRKWAVQVVGNHPHLCIVCNSDVTTMIQTDPTPVRAEVGSSSSFPSPEIPWEVNEDSHLMTCHGETNVNPSTSSGGYEVSNSLGIPSSRIPRELIQLSSPMTFHFETHANPSDTIDGYGVSSSLGTSSSGIPREVVQVGPSMTSHGETDGNPSNTSDGYEVGNSLGIPSSGIPRESIQPSPPMTFHFESHVNPSDGYGVSSSLGTSSSGIPREVVQVGPSMTSHGETDVNLSNPSNRYISCSIRTSSSGIRFQYSEIKIGRPIDPQARKKQLRKKKQEARDLSRKKNDNHEQQ